MVSHATATAAAVAERNEFTKNDQRRMNEIVGMSSD
jgi:hypothetical protein